MQGQITSAKETKPDEGPKRDRQKKTRSKRRKAQSDEDWYNTDISPVMKDSHGRSFRVGSNYVTDETMASILEGSSNSDRTESVEDDSPLSPKKFIRYAENGLLKLSEVEEVASRVAAFNIDNPEILFDDTWVERFLFGVGSHHAGMLAAHKAFVEALFRAQLMKAVFATETLAAGINMPARSTVICALAKRGDGGSMNLLETGNLLQMAGRAGRRGMDTEGTCVIVATPFEGPEDAASILTNEIKPVVSQFTPSYSLAVNLVARGAGKLDVAKDLVRRSFAMWEKMQREESISSIKDTHGEEVDEVLAAVVHERFLKVLNEALEAQLPHRSASEKRSLSKIPEILEVLGDRKLLKKASKAYMGFAQILNLESSTLKYLQQEAEVMDAMPIEENDSVFGDLFVEDSVQMQSEIETQRKRVLKSEIQVNSHVFTAIAEAANVALARLDVSSEILCAALQAARSVNGSSDAPVTAEELTKYAKSATVVNRKRKKMKSKVDGDTEVLFDQIDQADEAGDDAWDDMLALTNVLEAYGCMSPLDESVDDSESQTFQLSPAGEDIGCLGFGNSLWCLVAMGGAWDVAYESAELDEFRAAMDSIGADSDEADILTDGNIDTSDSDPPKPQQEAESLVSLLRSLSSSELAGYVSCLVNEGNRGGSANIVESFQRLSPTQQRVIQNALLSLERLMEVQKKFSVDETSSKCQLELTSCDVVTAWADGCTWNEALEMSGGAPGDLARTLNRALDGLRQIGNLPYHPVRATITATQTASCGIHPDIRRLCREAARAMDRYPVKDPLPFTEDEVEIEVELDGANGEEMVEGEEKKVVARDN